MGRSRYQNVDVVWRYSTPDDLYFSGFANLPNQIARTLRYVPAQYLVTVFGNPNDVVLDIGKSVRACTVLGHSLILVENCWKLTASKAVGLDPILLT